MHTRCGMPVEVRRQLFGVDTLLPLWVLRTGLSSGLHDKHFDQPSHPRPALKPSVCILTGYISATVSEFYTFVLFCVTVSISPWCFSSDASLAGLVD